MSRKSKCDFPNNLQVVSDDGIGNTFPTALYSLCLQKILEFQLVPSNFGKIFCDVTCLSTVLEYHSG